MVAACPRIDHLCNAETYNESAMAHAGNDRCKFAVTCPGIPLSRGIYLPVRVVHHVGSSPIWHEIGQAATYRRRLAALSAGVLALVGVSQVNRYIQSNLMERQEEMGNRLTTVVQKYPISDSIVQQVLSRYAPITDTKTTRPQ